MRLKIRLEAYDTNIGWGKLGGERGESKVVIYFQLLVGHF